MKIQSIRERLFLFIKTKGSTTPLSQQGLFFVEKPLILYVHLSRACLSNGHVTVLYAENMAWIVWSVVFLVMTL
jgi:hypothetical protein